ncbi:unnamed protein product [Mycena citricolor]|uniref:Uncharacterized protein n=1 Tax=Mycena citricolor TaxID=2018698 RepID=A0AAD2HXC3_9AGAR|nr:unnamed protein product [Mycena citricolor]
MSVLCLRAEVCSQRWLIPLVWMYGQGMHIPESRVKLLADQADTGRSYHCIWARRHSSPHSASASSALGARARQDGGRHPLAMTQESNRLLVTPRPSLQPRSRTTGTPPWKHRMCSLI